MARAPWLIDSKRIATKIMNPNYDPLEEDENNGATRECPHCNHQINNNDLAQKWPGLPAGVKFDPSDQELLGHLAAKIGLENTEPHPFINEFIPTVEKDDGICYTHPENLPGVKQDGSICHFFHMTTNAYLKGKRKRRKINSEANQVGIEVRWHKTGKTRPVIENGIPKGWKKILVLYWSNKRGKTAEKTNWVMHQYHLGTEEDERDNEYVVSKILYQQEDKQCDKTELPDMESTPVTPGDPVTPLASTPELPRREKWCAHLDAVQEEQLCYIGNPDQANVEIDDLTWEAPSLTLNDSIWLAGESLLQMNSQEALDEFLYCNENLQISSHREKVGSEEIVPGLVEHGRVEAEEAEDANATSSLDNIELDTPPEVPSFELQFNSQESLSAWTNEI